MRRICPACSNLIQDHKQMFCLSCGELLSAGAELSTSNSGAATEFTNPNRTTDRSPDYSNTTSTPEPPVSEPVITIRSTATALRTGGPFGVIILGIFALVGIGILYGLFRYHTIFEIFIERNLLLIFGIIFAACGIGGLYSMLPASQASPKTIPALLVETRIRKIEKQRFLSYEGVDAINISDIAAGHVYSLLFKDAHGKKYYLVTEDGFTSNSRIFEKNSSYVLTVKAGTVLNIGARHPYPIHPLEDKWHWSGFYKPKSLKCMFSGKTEDMVYHGKGTLFIMWLLLLMTFPAQYLAHSLISMLESAYLRWLLDWAIVPYLPTGIVVTMLITDFRVKWKKWINR